MQLTGVNYRLVPYQYYDAALANGASYTFTVSGMASGIEGGGSGGSGYKYSISGNGAAWSTAADSVGTVSEQTIVTYENCTKITNNSGGAKAIHIVGWYIS